MVEMVVVLAIIGVIIGIAVPGFRNVTLATRLTNYANSLVSTVYLARGEAIKRNADVRMCASSDGATCALAGGWSQGWIVLDPNDLVVSQQAAIENGFFVNETGGIHQITFDSAGAADAASVFKICRQTPSVGYQDRQVDVSTIGRTNVTRTATGSCP